MMQDTKALPAPIGVIYDTSMTRPDAALALSALYVSASRRSARVGAVCVSGAGLDAAIFCDIVARFYTGQTRPASSNAVLPIGLDAASPTASDAPWVGAAAARRKDGGEPQYATGIQRVTDTAAADALLRNSVTFSAESVVVLSAPPRSFAASVALSGTLTEYKKRVKRVVIVEAGVAGQDGAALRTLAAELPAPVVFCGREVGEALACPRAQIDALFTWTPANPVADAIRASGAPQVQPHDLAALHYALHPDSGFFVLSDPGALEISGQTVRFAAGGAGTARRLTLDPARTKECLEALLGLATSRPAPPPGRGGA